MQRDSLRTVLVLKTILGTTVKKKHIKGIKKAASLVIM